MKKYRFDDAYEKIYELNGNAYVYLTNYFSTGVTKSMSYAEAEHEVESWKDGLFEV